VVADEDEVDEDELEGVGEGEGGAEDGEAEADEDAEEEEEEEEGLDGEDVVGDDRDCSDRWCFRTFTGEDRRAGDDDSFAPTFGDSGTEVDDVDELFGDREWEADRDRDGCCAASAAGTCRCTDDGGFECVRTRCW